MEKIKLGSLCTEKIENISVKQCDWLDYIDISSVDNVSKSINGYTTYSIDEAPSRAKQILKKGDILVSTVRPNLNAVAMCDVETNNTLVGSTGFCVLRPDDNTNSKCIFYFCQSKYFVNELMSVATGASYPAVSKGDVQGVLFPKYSISEQNEIARKLDVISLVIKKKKKQINELDELIKSQFVELFGKVNDKIMLKELCDVTGGYSFKSTDIIDEGIKLLQISNVALNQIDWDLKNCLPLEFEEKYSNFLMEKDDIVMALTRPIIQSLGNVKTCIVNDSDLPCLLNQRVGKIKVKDINKTKAQFIYHCFMTDEFTRYVESCCTGCSQPNISTKDIESYRIPDVSIELQDKFVTFVQQVDKLKFEVQKSLDETQILFESLMQKYFG